MYAVFLLILLLVSLGAVAPEMYSVLRNAGNGWCLQEREKWGPIYSRGCSIDEPSTHVEIIRTIIEKDVTRITLGFKDSIKNGVVIGLSYPTTEEGEAVYNTLNFNQSHQMWVKNDVIKNGFTYFTLASNFSGKCLTSWGYKSHKGEIVQSTCRDSNENQLWRFSTCYTCSDDESGGYAKSQDCLSVKSEKYRYTYKLRNSHMCLYADSHGSPESRVTNQWCQMYTPAQIWSATAAKSKDEKMYFRLRNDKAGTCLSSSEGGGDDGTGIVLAECDISDDAQLWGYVDSPNVPCFSLKQLKSGKCISNSNKADKYNTQQILMPCKLDDSDTFEGRFCTN